MNAAKSLFLEYLMGIHGQGAAWVARSRPGRFRYGFLEVVWLAAARWARAAKLLEETWPLPARAWAD